MLVFFPAQHKHGLGKGQECFILYPESYISRAVDFKEQLLKLTLQQRLDVNTYLFDFYFTCLYFHSLMPSDLQLYFSLLYI